MNHKEFIDAVRERTRQVIIDGDSIITHQELLGRLSSRFSDTDILEISLQGSVYLASIVKSEYVTAFVKGRTLLFGESLDVPEAGDLRLIEDSVQIEGQIAERINFSQYYSKYKNVTDLLYPYYVYEDCRFLYSGGITDYDVVVAPSKTSIVVASGSYTFDNGTRELTLPGTLADETPVILHDNGSTHTFNDGVLKVYDSALTSITGDITAVVYPLVKFSPPVVQGLLLYTTANMILDLGFAEEAKALLKELSAYIGKYTLNRIGDDAN